ncbi:ABC transporter permease [Marinobacter zhejiangensis]|uniref:Putative ABC transport system permease protein n=1 Tax=Marinobacter zhejiangensis TaxID=488535 RepID=A0A1I4Q464_9GAMM|nr:ABC transporter permease [Marinobacter zhejiangensis]SFM34413.1 putative ABC transport system permease protein [Marinobacter zhejiangensis]
MNAPELSLLDLGLAALIVVATAGFVRPLSKRSANGLLVGMARMSLQLALIGLVLKALFENVTPYWVLLVSLVMLLAAGREVMARQHYRRHTLAEWRNGLFAMAAGSFSLTLLALLVMIDHDPWYHPRFAIPFLGMMLGNTMTAIALTISRILEGAHQQRAILEERLALGERWQDAASTIRRDGIRQGLIPVINMMAASGIVSLPGMMTGQLLAGADPVNAVSYQILIILLIAGGTTTGILVASRLTLKQLFDERHRLRLDRFREEKEQ